MNWQFTKKEYKWPIAKDARIKTKTNSKTSFFFNLSDGQDFSEKSVAICFPPPVKSESQYLT